MVFGATYACAACRVRFARLERCPACGGTTIFSLTTREGRARYREAAQGASRRWETVRAVCARWAPDGARIATPIAVGVFMMLPRFAFANHSVGAVLLSAVGAALALGAVLVSIAAAIAVGPPLATAGRARVHAPAVTPRDDDTTLTGIARRASVEIASPLSGEPCLLFGLRGEVGAADVCDADGGDFDLELPSGERVMISLEHAVLDSEAPAAGSKPPATIGDVLASLLEQRAIADAEGRAALGEVVVFDGDEVTVTGTVLGGKVTSLAYRGGSGPRVLAGTAAHLLRVRPRAGSRQ